MEFKHATKRDHNQEQEGKISINIPFLIYVPQKNLLSMNLDNFL
jgi:hypothetical protein